MRKTGRCIRIVIVGLTFACFFQLAVFLYFSSKTFSDGKERGAAGKITTEEVVRSFVKHAALNSVPVLPIQPAVLRKFLHSGTSLPFCFYFCHSKVHSFATFNDIFAKKKPFLSALTEDGFRHTVTEKYDEKMLAQDVVVNLTLRYVFLKGDIVLQLVIFIRHEGNFLWHGGLNYASLARLNSASVQHQDFAFSDKEGAYDTFDVYSVEVDGAKLHLPRDIDGFLSQTVDSSFIECNYTRARLFYNQFGLDNSEGAAEFKTLAWKILSLASRSLNSLKVRFWLSSGTCLGFFRQCDIFGYGRDVDIGIWIKDYRPLIVESLLSSGMQLKHKFGRINDSLEFSFIYAGIKLDIFFFYEADDHMWNGGLQARTGKKFKYVFPKFNLCWTEFLGLKVRIPCQTQQYIEANYGPNWFTPVMTWDWKSSPSNVHSNGQWPVEEWSEVIQQFEINSH